MDRVIESTARCPGTCGELVEGVFEGSDFLITCPVDMWSEVTVKEGFNGDSKARELFPKTWRAADLAFAKLGAEKEKFKICRKSDIPVGKGMGSSTADISAVVKAVARSLGKEISEDFIANIALDIEPSDATMYPGIYMFDHKEGTLKEYLGEPLPIDIVVLDPGGEVDTMKFNSQKNLGELNAKKEPLIKQARELVVRGFKEGDPEKVGRGATISSKANQEILPKPQLDNVIILAEKVKSLGVNVAHSGTVLGVLLSPYISDKEEVAEFFKYKFKDYHISTTKLVGGGVK